MRGSVHSLASLIKLWIKATSWFIGRRLWEFKLICAQKVLLHILPLGKNSLEAVLDFPLDELFVFFLMVEIAGERVQKTILMMMMAAHRMRNFHPPRPKSGFEQSGRMVRNRPTEWFQCQANQHPSPTTSAETKLTKLWKRKKHSRP